LLSDGRQASGKPGAPFAGSIALSYGCAVASIVLATGVRLLLDPVLGDQFPIATLFFAVMLTAWYGGFGPALVSVVLGGIAANYFLLLPRGSFGLKDWDQQVGLVLYLSVGLGIALLGGVMRAAQLRAEASAQAERRQREHLRITVASIGDAVITTDAEGRVVSLNGVAEALTGWKQGDAKGRPLQEVFVITNEMTGQVVENPATRALREGAIVGLANHTLLTAKDGTQRPVDDSAAPIRDEKGAVSGVVLVFRDVTERRRLERLQSGLQEQLERQVQERTAELRHEAAEREKAQARQIRTGALLQAIVDTSADGIVMIDEAHRIVTFSAGAEAIFGYKADEVIGQPVEILLPERYREQHGRHIEKFAGSPETNRRMGARGKVYGRNKSGATFPAEVSVAKLHVDGQRFFTAVVRDVTQAERAAAMLQQAQKMEAVGQLTGGIAHDFNNILGVIVGNLDLLNEELGPAHPSAGLAKSALDAALRGADMVGRLLTFSRGQNLKPTVFAVNDAIEGIAPMLRRSIGERVPVELSLDPETGAIEADRHQLESALLNLAINARDAMPSGGRVTIVSRPAVVDADNAAMYPDLKLGSYAVIALTDEGQGIPPEILQRVFEPFFTTKPEGKGTGLGLSMVYGFMRQSGGTAKIYSEVGHGTTVRLYFPRSGTVAAAGEPERAAALDPATGGETVLVVEDRPDVRQVAVVALTRLGYKTIEAANAAEALAAVEAGNKIDLVFSDIVMPGKMSGLDLVREIRRRGLPVAVLLTSGYASPQALHEQAQAAGLPVLSKPFRFADLAEQVRAALRSKTKGSAS
jgi:PAS domain S-box-containing protein